ncbi:MAG: dCTP deaminase [Rhodobacteraceae bacterium]|nr:dCTP deaminase [Paracoccaceae bacterium]
MILTGNEITNQVRNGNIVISPFSEDRVNPNSYNFTLADKLDVYEEGEIDVRKQKPTRRIHIGPEGYVLTPGRLYLASTVEVLGSDSFVPTYAARSSVARLGMFINLSAPLGDIGFIGCWTLQLLAMNSIRLYAGMPIGQMMFWQVKGNIDLYDGKYQGARGPLSSRIYQDFDQKKTALAPPEHKVLGDAAVAGPAE